MVRTDITYIKRVDQSSQVMFENTGSAAHNMMTTRWCTRASVAQAKINGRFGPEQKKNITGIAVLKATRLL